MQKIFAHHSITLFDVEEILTQEGSLRIYGKHDTYGSREISENVKNLIDKEISFGINDLNTYKIYEEQVKE